MKVTQHIPGFVSGVEPERHEVSSQEDLLNLEFVKRQRSYEGFHRFSLSENCLMAEFKGGKEWWVIAFLDSTEGIDLPVWKSQKGDSDKEFKGSTSHGFVIRAKRPYEAPAKMEIQGEECIHLSDPSPNRYNLKDGVYIQVYKYIKGPVPLNPEWETAEFEDAIYFHPPKSVEV